MVATIDYSALEDRVIANLSGDVNKLSVFTEGLDGHSLAATYYFPERVKKVIGSYTDNKEASKKLKELVDTKDPIAKEIRQNSKPVTFGISYGAYPPKIAATIKCPIKEAEDIFNAYHNKMYPDITRLREKVLYKAKQDGYVHLGLGCRLYSSDVEKNSRTLFNAISQFWSILTLLVINKLHDEIDDAGLAEDIKVITTIFDSIYLVVKKDAETIKWLNDTICPLMERDFLKDQIVKNEANLEIGDSWANLIELPHNISTEEIEKVMKEFE
jgi:DNA polymerase I-like protein with 3'-5' exonuclease and polymerase domains